MQLMPLEPPDQQRWQAAVGFVELQMFQDANDELEKIDPFNRASRQDSGLIGDFVKGCEV
jgi:hypothetical protein